MRAPRVAFSATSAAFSVVALVSGCVFAATSSPASPSCPAEGSAPIDSLLAHRHASCLSRPQNVARIGTLEPPADHRMATETPTQCQLLVHPSTHRMAGL